MATAVQSDFADRTPLVGRTPELDKFRDLLEQMKQSRGQLVLVSGEAGVGKSRFCDEAAAIALRSGTIVLTGHCLGGDAPLPYLPFLELIEAAARQAPDEVSQALGESASQLAALAPHLRTQFPEIPAMPPYLPEHERQYVFSAVRDFLDRLSHRVPLVLVFEDIHWADTSTLLLIRHLVQFVAARRILMLATYRPSEVGDPDTSGQARASMDLLVDQVHRSRAGHVVLLGELSVDDVAAMLLTIAGKPAPADVSLRFHELTGGNPFFVEQVVKHFLEERRLFDVRGDWTRDLTSEAGVPDSVRLVIQRRLKRAGEANVAILATAAAIGRNFDGPLLARVCGVDQSGLEDALDQAERAQLVVSEREGRATRFTFAHDLIRQTLLADLTLPRRQRLHAAIAAAIEEIAGPGSDERAGDLAYHYVRAGDTADPQRALHYLRLAADHAMSATAYERAAELYDVALNYVSPNDLAGRCDLLLSSAEARKRVSDSETARRGFGEAAELAKQVGDGDQLARAALGYARSWPTISSVDTEAVDLLNDALAAVSVEDVSLRARLSARLSLQLLYSGSPEDVLERTRAAVAVARDSGDMVTLARALQVLHATLWQPAHLEERLRVATEILGCAAGAGDRAVALWGQRPRIADLSELARMDEAEAEIDAYDRLASDVRQPIFLWQAAVRRAMLAIFKGELDEGERLAQRALELGQRAEGQNLIAAFGGQLIVIRWQQGRLEELRQLVTSSRDSQPQVKLWSAVLAFIESESGNTPSARAEFERLAAGRFASLPNEDTRLVVLVLATLVCAALGDGLRAEELYELLVPYDGRNIVVSEGVACVGAASHYLGLLSAAARRWEDAERHFLAAIELNSRTGGRPWLAHAQYELAQMLLSRRRAGDRGRSRDLLRSALGIARDSGMRGLQNKIERLQRSHRRLVPERPDGLTARELEVLRLMASGHSTREISERLVLSPRTTSRHIANIYAKIGVRNRVEASAYALKHHFDL